MWGRRPALRVASGFRLEARLREKFRWKPSDLQNTRRPAFLGTALDRGEKTHGKSPGRSVFAKGNQYEERNGPDPCRPAGRSFLGFAAPDAVMVFAHQGDKGSVSVGDKHFRTQAFKVRLVNAAKSEISLKNSCLVAQSAAGQSFRLDTVDEELTAETLKPGASVEGDDDLRLRRRRGVRRIAGQAERPVQVGD
ncbi:DUF4354 family protein [Pseudomonas aeruginosa]|nr:DUF4354 family protein [Pseudomonas aeruginosa]